MAEAASAVPTFKLVLVGDGGTGKVRLIGRLDPPLLLLEAYSHLHRSGGASQHRSTSNKRNRLPSSSAI